MGTPALCPGRCAVKVLFAGGGTGGHVYPGLAIASYLRRAVVDFEALFVGNSRGLESHIVPAAGFVLQPIPGAGVRRMGFIGRLRGAVSLLRGVVAALGIMRRWRPDVVVATGGWASLAGGLAAVLLRRPLLVQEQNAIPGLTNRLLSRFAKQIHIAFPGARHHFPAAVCERVHLTGNPVRDELLQLGSSDAKPETTLLVVGGSRGARSINAAVADAIPRVGARHAVRWLWQTGEMDHAQHASRWGSVAGTPEVECVAYLEDMVSAYAKAALMICRAGAMTLAEIAVVGVPAILVPFPGAVDDHQTANARHLVDAGAAILIPDAELSGTRLATEIDRLLTQPGGLDGMRQRARSLARPAATRTLAAAVVDLAAGKEGVAYVRSG